MTSVSKTLCRLDAIPDGAATAIELDSDSGRFSLILLRRGEHVFAYHNECPHAGRRLDWAPGKFLIDGDQLICAAHGASFFIDSGKCHGGPCLGAGLVPIAVDVIEGEVRLRE